MSEAKTPTPTVQPPFSRVRRSRTVGGFAEVDVGLIQDWSYPTAYVRTQSRMTGRLTRITTIGHLRVPAEEHPINGVDSADQGTIPRHGADRGDA